MKLLCPDSLRVEIAPLVPEGDDGILISYLWPKRVPAEELARYRLALNFHPAPLPEYRGFAPYTWGVLNGAWEWGVTLHEMVDEIDAGPVLREMRWNIDARMVTAIGLKEMAHRMLKQLLIDCAPYWKSVAFWYRQPQVLGRYYSRLDFENARRYAGWNPEVARRAFWCPPHPGWEPIL